MMIKLTNILLKSYFFSFLQSSFRHQRRFYVSKTLVNFTTNKPKLELTDKCVKRLNEICNDGTFLRIIIEGGGCSGFQYKFEVDNKLNADDLQFGSDVGKVVIDETSIEYIDGSTIDFHEELIRAGFRILNPKAEGTCSCGSSFNLKIE